MNEKKLMQEINDLKQEMAEFKKEKSPGGFKNFINKSLSKLSLVIGVTLAFTISSIFLYASQMFFEDGTIIQSSEVNNNFSELYQKLTDLEAVKSNKPQIFRYLNYDDNDYTNTGWTALDYSLFTAEKKSETSRLKITWTDSYRTISPNSNGGVCGWELRIDSDSCSPQPLYHFQHDTGSNPSSNKSMTSTVVQICDGVPAGNLKLQVFGKRRDGDEDCLRGYGSGLFSGDPFPASIIIEEVE